MEGTLIFFEELVFKVKRLKKKDLKKGGGRKWGRTEGNQDQRKRLGDM